MIQNIVLAKHTNDQRSLLVSSEFKTKSDLYSYIQQKLSGKCVEDFLKESPIAKAASKTGDIYLDVRKGNVNQDAIHNFFESIVNCEEIPIKFWTERYDTLVEILTQYVNKEGAVDETVQKVNNILTIFNEEVQGQASILTTYSHFIARELQTQAEEYCNPIKQQQAGTNDQTLIDAFKKYLPAMDDVHIKCTQTVQGLKGLDCSLEEFVAIANKGNLPRQLDLGLIESNLITNEYGKPMFQVASFYDTQIKGKNVSDITLFYFLLFLNRFNYGKEEKSGDTGVFAEVNGARGGLRWNGTEKLWDAISTGQVGQSFFREFANDSEGFKNKLRIMKELEQNNFEVCISMTTLGITNFGAALQMECPSWARYFFDGGLLAKQF